MKYSVFTVSAPDYAPEELLPIIRGLGYDGVEWRVTNANYSGDKPAAYWSNNKCTVDVQSFPQRARALKDLCDGQGVEICALGTYFTCGQTEQIQPVIKAAAEIDVKRLRVSPFGYDGSERYAALFDRAIACYKVLEDMSRQYGVKVDIEMHPGNLTPSASAAYRLVSHFDARRIGVIYDVGNLVSEGYEPYPLGVDLLGEYLDHVHYKNEAPKKTALPGGAVKWTVEAARLPEGQADLKAALAALKRSGYRGYLSFEDFSNEDSTLEKMQKNIAYTKKLEDEA